MYDLPKMMTVAEVAGLWNCSKSVVTRQIRSGALDAIDISPPGSKAPRWRIPSTEALARLEPVLDAAGAATSDESVVRPPVEMEDLVADLLETLNKAIALGGQLSQAVAGESSNDS